MLSRLRLKYAPSSRVVPGFPRNGKMRRGFQISLISDLAFHTRILLLKTGSMFLQTAKLVLAKKSVYVLYVHDYPRILHISNKCSNKNNHRSWWKNVCLRFMLKPVPSAR